MLPLASPPRILIVETDRIIGDLLQYFLEDEGYPTDLVSSLKEASTALGIQTYQLILLDFFHPSLYKIFLAAEHLQQQMREPTPVGLLSSWELPAEEVQRQRIAFLLPKPFDLDRLLHAVTTAVHSSSCCTPSAELAIQPEALLVPL